MSISEVLNIHHVVKTRVQYPFNNVLLYGRRYCSAALRASRVENVLMEWSYPRFLSNSNPISITAFFSFKRAGCDLRCYIFKNCGLQKLRKINFQGDRVEQNILRISRTFYAGWLECIHGLIVQLVCKKNPSSNRIMSKFKTSGVVPRIFKEFTKKATTFAEWLWKNFTTGAVGFSVH